MKLIHKLTFALLSIFVIGSACAGPLTSKEGNATSLSSSSVNSLLLVHNFLSEEPPFRLGIDEITSATIYLKLKDDNGGKNGGGDEQFSFLLGNGESFGGANLDTNGAEFTHILLDLTGLNASGMMSVSVTALDGAFQFQSSTLVVQVTRGETQVELPPQAIPEPLSIALIGLGLAGMTAVRRRK